MRCVYCYNPDIVFGKGKISFDETLNFLNKRKGLLDGVVLSGGECTSHKRIQELLIKVKELGFLVKVDTNGSHPEKLKNFIETKLIDYIALDFKAMQNKYFEITKSNLFNDFLKSLKYLSEINFPFEVRTTVHSDLHSNKDIEQMINILEEVNYKGTYYLQYYRNDSETIGNIKNSETNYFNLNELKPNINVQFRNYI